MKAIDIITTATLQQFLSSENPVEGTFEPQAGYTREELCRRHDSGEVVYLYRIHQRSITIWARSKAGSSNGFLCHTITLYRWQMLPIMEVFARLDSMSFVDNEMADALGLPVMDILESSFYENVKNFLPQPAPVYEVEVEPVAAMAAPMEEICEEPAPEVHIEEEPAPVVLQVEEPTPVAQIEEEPAPVIQIEEEHAPVVLQVEEPAPVAQTEEETAPVVLQVEEEESCSVHEDSAHEDSSLAELLRVQHELEQQRKELLRWKAMYAETMRSERNDRPEEEMVRTMTRPLWLIREDTLLSFLSGLKLVHLDWLFIVAALVSFFFLVAAIKVDHSCLWPLVSTAISILFLQLSVGSRNDGFFEIKWGGDN